MSSVKSVAIALGVWLACVSSAAAQAPALNAPQLPPVPEPPPAPGEAAVQPVFEGPLHEAFLSPAKDRDPQHVDKAPPAPIAERPGVEPPSERARWVPGYWEWDTSRSDFVWVTGCWRVPPPGKFWVDGYWKRDDQGWYRVPGFWSDRLTDRIDYRKTGPPADRPEENPGPAPAEDTFYVPGQYEPDGDGVVWRPGYWTKAQPGWAWVPSQWNQQPEGWIFQPGYWDRTLEDRGTLFTPAVVNEADGVTTQDLVYQPMQQVAPATYGSLYGALGRPSVYYDGYPGCYYDPNGQYYGYAQYGTLGLYTGYLDFPYAGSVGYPYLTPAYDYGAYGGYGYGLGGYGLNYLGGLGCGLGSTLGLGYGYGYGGYGYGYGGYGLGLLGGLGRVFGLGLGFGYPYYGYGFGGLGYGLGGLGYGLGYGGYGWGYPGYGLGWGGYGWGYPGFGYGWGYPGLLGWGGYGWGGLGWGGLGWGGWGHRNHHRGGYPFHGGHHGGPKGGWGGGGWGGGGWAGNPGRHNPGRWAGNPGFPNSGGVGRLPRGGVAPGPRQANPGGGRASLPPNLAMQHRRGHTPPAASMPFANPFGGSTARHAGAGAGRRAGPVAVGSNTGVFNAPHVQNVRHVAARPALNPTTHRTPALGQLGQGPNNRALATPRGSQVLPGASAGRALGGLPGRGMQAGNLGTIGRLNPGSNPAIANRARPALTAGARPGAARPGPSVGSLSRSALPNRSLANPALRAGGAAALPNAAQHRGNVPIRSGMPNAGALGSPRPGLATRGLPNAGFAQQAQRAAMPNAGLSAGRLAQPMQRGSLGSVGLPARGFSQPMQRGSIGGFGGLPSGGRGFAQPMQRGSMGGFGGMPSGGFSQPMHRGSIGGFGGMPSGGFGGARHVGGGLPAGGFGGGMGRIGGAGGGMGRIGGAGGMGHVGGMGHAGGHGGGHR